MRFVFRRITRAGEASAAPGEKFADELDKAHARAA
jgi:hypothetical protein